MTEQFHWTSPDGIEITLPHVSKIKAGVLRKSRKLNELDFVFTVIEAVADEANLAKIDELGADEINDLFGEWQQAATLGESSGSSS